MRFGRFRFRLARIRRLFLVPSAPCKLHDDYEWGAVVEYHMAFHTKRLREMIGGDFSQWGRVDAELREKLLRDKVQFRSSRS